MADDFYLQVLRWLMADGALEREHRILVVAGGMHDGETVRAAELEDVVISNLDTRMDASLYTPFEWSFQDAEALTYPDRSFDWCIEHNGLHHCHSPHRALLEMYRVARKGVLFFEPYDNLVTRFGVRLGVGQDYEHAAVFYNDLKFGGVRNTEIPNFIYRWNRREIEKTINCNAPYGPHRYRYFHRVRMPWGQLRSRKNPLYLLAAYVTWPTLKLMERILPSQCNCFAAAILKPDLSRETLPWLKSGSDGEAVLNKEWLRARYVQRSTVAVSSYNSK